jgi:glycosyltransferase involved in cell wall biosynthesis
MKFTIIIPTRKRSDTLYYTLKTCVTQNYDDLEILVSDNFSQDKTREIVDSFKDERIRYINTGKSVSMSRNWEFALDHVNDGYFTFVGDDDGLLPEAVKNVRDIITLTGTSAVTWLKVEYCWPSHPFLEDYLRIPLLNTLAFTECKKVRNGILNLWSGYSRGPCFYNSFIHCGIAKRLKAKSGVFFGSVTPDVYSALATCSVLDNFYYSTRPFSINGASHHSNGTAGGMLNQPQPPAKTEIHRFMAELDLPQHPKFPIILGSLNSALIEAFSQANLLCFGNKLPILDTLWIFKISKELSKKPRGTYDKGMEDLEGIYSRIGKSWLFKICRKLFPNKPSGLSTPTYGLDSRSCLSINAKSLGVTDVAQACIVAHNLLGTYTIPSRVSTYSFSSLVKKNLGRRTARIGMWLQT